MILIFFKNQDLKIMIFNFPPKKLNLVQLSQKFHTKTSEIHSLNTNYTKISHKTPSN